MSWSDGFGYWSQYVRWFEPADRYRAVVELRTTGAEDFGIARSDVDWGIRWQRDLIKLLEEKSDGEVPQAPG